MIEECNAMTNIIQKLLTFLKIGIKLVTFKNIQYYNQQATFSGGDQNNFLKIGMALRICHSYWPSGAYHIHITRKHYS